MGVLMCALMDVLMDVIMPHNHEGARYDRSCPFCQDIRLHVGWRIWRQLEDIGWGMTSVGGLQRQGPVTSGQTEWHRVMRFRHGKSWKIMANHGKSWQIMANHGKSWQIIANHGKSSQITANTQHVHLKTFRWQKSRHLQPSKCETTRGTFEALKVKNGTNTEPNLRTMHQLTGLKRHLGRWMLNDS
jgi:hypothetical protein